MSAELNKILTTKSLFLQNIRLFLQKKDIVEVIVPVLDRFCIPDLHIEPVKLSIQNIPYFLQSSPELAIKRLLCQGVGDCYVILPSFRANENQGSIHKQEFTMLEWYRLDMDYMDLADEVIELFLLLDDNKHNLTVEKITYNNLLTKYCGLAYQDVTLENLKKICSDKSISLPIDNNKQDILDLIMGVYISEQFHKNTLTIVYNYPKEQASLSVIKNDISCRFEIYWDKIELANGFLELRDNKEQQDRFEAINIQRMQNQQDPLPIDRNFINNLEHMPLTSGVAVGLDRLFMKIADHDEIL
jgi:lysyl-tRNA synthetase class 2